MRYRTRSLTVEAHTPEPGTQLTTVDGPRVVAPGDVLLIDGPTLRLLPAVEFAYLFEPAPDEPECCDEEDEPEPKPRRRRRDA